ncbi:hypothetical protein [Endozoicomonas sp. ONNA2]|uniref:hypothetical protein n=1 Tax=Endozoicomonas sp. ONNA2 TaxID=2828741 RepID=UPI0021481ADA|nr:hypothetical protein [Endozoicomonas sp. ONNA2]
MINCLLTPPMEPMAYRRANRPNGGWCRTASTFDSRSVAHGRAGGDDTTEPAKRIANGDPARQDQLRQISKDGGKSAFERMVAKLEESGTGS